MILSNDELADNLCRKLKQIRNIADISMNELASKLGLSRQTINNLESGRVAPTYSHVIATLAVLDYKLKTHSPEWYSVQKILDISPEKLGVNSFLEYWFRISEMRLRYSGNDNELFSLYDSLINEKPETPMISISELVGRSDKIYIFADSLMHKECMHFLDILTEYIADVRKLLPLVILRSHIQGILETKTTGNEDCVVEIYKKLNQLKEKNIIFIEESIYSHEDYLFDFSNIHQTAMARNLFISVITENKEVLAQSVQNIKGFCIDSFNDELKEKR